MQLPKLTPGKRFAMPRPVGAADALLLAQLALREKTAGKATAIITADATDAQRLLAELPFFAPKLRCVLFPDWETLPYDAFSPHQDLISERLATLWRIHNRGHGGSREEGADVVIVPATTALYRLAPPAFLAATPLLSKPASNWMKPGSRPSSRWRATSTSPRWSAPANTRCAAG